MKGHWPLCIFAVALPVHSLSRVERFAVSVGSAGPEATAEVSANELAEVLLKLPSAHEAQLAEVAQERTAAELGSSESVVFYAILFTCVPLCTCAALLLLFADGEGSTAYASARECKGSEPRVISFTKPGSKPLGPRGPAQSLLDPEESGSGPPTLQPMVASENVSRDSQSDTALLIPAAVMPFHQDTTVVISSVSWASSSEFFAKFVFSEDAFASGILVYDGARNQVGSLDTSKAVGPPGEPKKSDRSVTLYRILESGLPGAPLAVVARVSGSILVKQNSQDIFHFGIDAASRLNEAILGPHGRIATLERSTGGPSLLNIARGQDVLMVLMATIAALKLL